MNADIQSTLGQEPNVKPKRNPMEMENIFKTICIILLMILVFCVPGFLKFRDYCMSKNYYVFAVDSFRWCTLGFFLVFVTNI